MQVILIRHSMTAGNVLRRYIGRTDEPLSPEGIALAKQAGIDPDVRTVYVSPLQRTQQTAAILFPNALAITVDDLREMDFGDFEGRNFEEMAEDSAYCAWLEGNCLSVCPNGESRSEFSARVCDAFAKIITNAAKQGEETVTLVIHGGTIMAIMERFARPCADYYSYSVKNCTGYCCQVALSKGEDDFVLTDHTLWERMQ